MANQVALLAILASAFLCHSLEDAASAGKHEEACNAVDGQCDSEETSLLQRREVRAGWSRPKKAITFEGGGYLSLADFSGLFMGLLRTHKRKFPGGSMKKLLKKFQIVAGISGGSWFLNQLIYSPKFLDLIHKGAVLPWFAGILYKGYEFSMLDPLGYVNVNQTIDDLIKCFSAAEGSTSAGAGSTSPNASLEAIASSRFGELTPIYRQYLMEALIVLQTGHLTWDALIQHMFEAGSGIDPKLGLGTKKVNAWSKGKLAITIASVVTPAGENTFYKNMPPLKAINIYSGKGKGNAKKSLAYTDSSFNGFSTVLPAKFSVIVGKGLAQKSPLPFVSAKRAIHNYRPKYSIDGQNMNENVDFSRGYRRAFEDDAGYVPISSASAVSSAAFGYPPLALPLFSEQNCLSLSVWSTNAKHGESFRDAQKMRDEIFANGGPTGSQARQAAKAALQPMLDGGYTDAFGIANAVIAGATDVLSVQDNDVTHGNVSKGLSDMFAGSPLRDRQVFKYPSSKYVDDWYANNITRIPAAPGSKYLSAIAYGTISCVTKQSDLYGIQKGRKVTLNVLGVESLGITIGYPRDGRGYQMDSFYQYGTLVEEIVRTLNKNDKASVAIIRKFFM